MAGFSQDYANLVSEMTIGESYTPYDNANAYLAVGDGNDAFAVSQSELQGQSTSRNPMEDGFPDRSDVNIVTFRARFGEDDANFHWRENAIFNDETDGVMMFRHVEDLGVKSQGQVWIFTKTITWDQDS